MMDVTVVVATYGHPDWLNLAHARAIPSAVAEVGNDHVGFIHHPDSLQAARNRCLELVDSRFVIFLDADDELEPGYVDAMSRGYADIRAPAMRSFSPRYKTIKAAKVPRVVNHTHAMCEPNCLKVGNWIVIGACVRTAKLVQAGGFEDFPMYEDWATWVKMFKRGASIEAIPEAVYRAHKYQGSRNVAGDGQAAHRAIATKFGLPLP